jgi:chromosome segregation ATPase
MLGGIFMDHLNIWQERIDDTIENLTRRVDKHETRLYDLEMSDKLQNSKIQGLEDTLKEIKDDTKWIRRAITGAIISATIVAIISGIIGIAITSIYGG